MFYNPRDALIALVMKYQGDWGAVYAAMRRKEEVEFDEAMKMLSNVHCKTLTILDAEYPADLRKVCHQPPFVLFYYGDINLIADYTRIITMVGSREPTPYAVSKGHELASGIADKGFIVLSGLARGIDTVVGEATASMVGKSIAVLGCGIERTYPSENVPLRDKIAKNGLLLSEYPGDVAPLPRNFPMRNRILAALSAGTLVLEAKEHSGTMITVAYAIQYNRDIAALPFRSEEATANNRLLKTGAALVETVSDLELFLSGRIVG